MLKPVRIKDTMVTIYNNIKKYVEKYSVINIYTANTEYVIYMRIQILTVKTLTQKEEFKTLKIFSQ